MRRFASGGLDMDQDRAMTLEIVTFYATLKAGTYGGP